MSTDAGAGKVIAITYPDSQMLYKAFLPHVKNGGLFIPDEKQHYAHMGMTIFLQVVLPKGRESFACQGKVCWINYGSTQGRRPGVGVRLMDGERERRLKVAIENELAAQLKSDQPTYTM